MVSVVNSIHDTVASSVIEPPDIIVAWVGGSDASFSHGRYIDLGG